MGPRACSASRHYRRTPTRRCTRRLCVCWRPTSPWRTRPTPPRMQALWVALVASTSALQCHRAASTSRREVVGKLIGNSASLRTFYGFLRLWRAPCGESMGVQLLERRKLGGDPLVVPPASSAQRCVTVLVPVRCSPFPKALGCTGRRPEFPEARSTVQEQ